MRKIELTGLARELADRHTSGHPVRIGLVGCGEMGTDIVAQVAQMRGIVVGAIAEVDPGRAEKAITTALLPPDSAARTDRASHLLSIIESGRTAITQDAAAVASCPLVDVVVDATGKPAVGAEIGLTAMEHGKHLVMMNVEADVTIGAYLRREAGRLGVVYTLGAGDEPSSCMELIEFVTALGYPVVAAGKGKNNPLDHDAIPSDYMAEARARNMNPRMLVEFVDGSKTMVEMAAIANATGLVPDVPGMHGPAASREALSSVLCPVEDGGILSRRGVVDYTIGKGVAPGVFVVAEIAHPRLRERMSDLKLGAGPYYTFYRPYHLTSLEVPLTCARAVLRGEADMVPLEQPVAEVCAVAKRDLQPGERLGQLGETDYRAFLMTVPDARAAGAIPCGLLESATITAPVRKGGLISSQTCAPDPGSRIFELRRRQDALTEGNPSKS